jgi:hypothetical protein
MRLLRTGEVSYEQGGKTIRGARGMLVIDTLSWPTVERLGVVHLVPDTYECEFGYWTDRNGRRWKALRILLTESQFQRIYGRASTSDRERGRIYIHAANWPHQLEGCIAPGVDPIENGVSQSRTALWQIFEALGGWKENERVTLEVA